MKKKKKSPKMAAGLPDIPLETPKRQVSIDGLEDLIPQGIPFGTVNLIAGQCGTGKSTFCRQFLYGKATGKEPGLYISLEDDPEDVIEHSRAFGWDFEQLIKDRKLIIIKPEVYKFEVIKEAIEDAFDRYDIKWVVIDSFSLISAYFNNTYDVRRSLSELKEQMKKFNATLFAITDIKEGEKIYSPDGFEEFVANGVIVLGMVSKPNSSEFIRTIFVRKMANKAHSLRMAPFEITEKGIIIYGDAEVF